MSAVSTGKRGRVQGGRERFEGKRRALGEEGEEILSSANLVARRRKRMDSAKAR